MPIRCNGSFDLKNGLIEKSHRVVFSKKLLGEKWDNAMGKTNVFSRPKGTPHFDSPFFCELKTVFRLKIEWNLVKGHVFFENSLPLTFYFSKIFKMIVEGSQIAHSIRNFILKNVIKEHFLIKWTCEERWSHFFIFNDFVTSSYTNKIFFDKMNM